MAGKISSVRRDCDLQFLETASIPLSGELYNAASLEGRRMSDAKRGEKPDWTTRSLRIIRSGQLDTSTPQTPRIA
jgi:hypothetical protein